MGYRYPIRPSPLPGWLKTCTEMQSRLTPEIRAKAQIKRIPKIRNRPVTLARVKWTKEEINT